MSKSSIAGLVLGLLVALPVAAQEPASAAKPEEMDTQTLLTKFRDELQALETEVVSKTMSLTTDEATKFWPVFKQFQAEQRTIMEGQSTAVLKYVGDYADLKDADALAYVNALLERDEKIHDLRVKYLGEYSKVLPPGKAARVIHISRRLGLAAQAKLASEIPLVH